MTKQQQFQRRFESSAPGSIMIMGEHAVLRNKLALVAAVDKRITVTLTPQENGHIEIYSELGEYHAHLHQLEDSSTFRFVIAAIKYYQEKIASGFRLDIHSEFSSTVGLGSSAAVVVATLSCIQQWINGTNTTRSYTETHATDLSQLFLDARAVIQLVQGRGSGADVAASVYGGIIAYRIEPCFIEKSDHIFDIALIYTGYKTPTPEVIRIVDEKITSNPEKYAHIFEDMNHYSEQAWISIQQKNWLKLGKIMQQHQLAQIELGVCDATTSELLALLEQDKHVIGCKISGSGLGDCVIALTTAEFRWHNTTFPLINAHLSSQEVISASS